MNDAKSFKDRIRATNQIGTNNLRPFRPCWTTNHLNIFHSRPSPRGGSNLEYNHTDGAHPGCAHGHFLPRYQSTIRRSDPNTALEHLEYFVLRKRTRKCVSRSFVRFGMTRRPHIASSLGTWGGGKLRWVWGYVEVTEAAKCSLGTRQSCKFENFIDSWKLLLVSFF